MADPPGSRSSSSAARAWNSRLYSMTGGQTVTMRGSEATVAQPVSEIVAIARTASRPVEHPPLDLIGLLRCLMSSEEHTSELQSLLRNSYAAFCLNKKRSPPSPPIHPTP